MISRLTLNLKMYDPSNMDFSLPPISKRLDFNHSHHSTDGRIDGRDLAVEGNTNETMVSIVEA